MMASALVLAACLVAVPAVRPEAASGADRGAMRFARSGLPEGSRVDRPLRRGPNGEIKIIDPTEEKGKGPRRCAAGAICVGRDQAYRKLSDALAVVRPGMTIEVTGGAYRESVAVRVGGLTIRGVAGTPHFDCAGLALAGNKACILLAADGITLDNLEISGAVLPPGLGANGACIRNEPDLSFTLRRIACHGSQDGMLTNGGRVVIENSEFYDNGWTGQTHNVYLGGRCTAVIVRGSTFRDARVGHEFKSRCQRTEISDSVFRSTHGSRDLDIPDGGETIVYRSTLVKTSGAESREIVGFAAESCAYPGDMILKEVAIENSGRDASIHNFDKCQGHPIVLQDVTTRGMPVRQIGYVLQR
jgi:Right handed beta helix region